MTLPDVVIHPIEQGLHLRSVGHHGLNGAEEQHFMPLGNIDKANRVFQLPASRFIYGIHVRLARIAFRDDNGTRSILRAYEV